jgi:O-antigen biosynthesis protein
MSKKYLVSAIVSTYNSERFIKGKIEDLLSQTIVDKVEIIVINSGSSQNEDVIINEYVHLYTNIKYIKTVERETIYKAWNRGIKLSTGQFITNSNTDDRLRKNAFEVLSEYLVDNPDVALIYANQCISTIENENYDVCKSNKKICYPDYSHIKQLERCIIGSQPMWRSSIHFNDNIWFNEKYEVCGDHEFELRISEKYKIHHLTKSLGIFYKSPNRTNKEYENSERTKKEVEEITNEFLFRFIKTLSKHEIEKIHKIYKHTLRLPIILYALGRMIEKRFINRMYQSIFPHSTEFLYYFNTLLLDKIGSKEKSIKLCKKYLKFHNSDRIRQFYNSIIL